MQISLLKWTVDWIFVYLQKDGILEVHLCIGYDLI